MASEATVIDPKQMVTQIATANSWISTESGDSVIVTVPIGALRKQNVTITFGHKDEEGHDVISYHSYCGPASEKNAMTLLRYNTKMIHGAFAIEKTDAGEMLTVQANQLADTADALEVTRVITAIAWQADKVEEKLLGHDEH